MGYRGQDIDTELDKSINRIIKRCEEISKPAYTYGYFDLFRNSDTLALAGSGITLPGKAIQKHLDGAKYCAILAVTLGMDMERALLLLEKKSMTDAVILDSAANAYIESVADCVENIITEESKNKGLCTNYRYSPGYGDFPIEMQKTLIPLLNCDRKIGLTVTENSIMIPRKSVTAVIGIFDEDQIKKKGCEGCSMYHSCNIRRNKTGKDGDGCDK